jgi:hypothetical protein
VTVALLVLSPHAAPAIGIGLPGNMPTDLPLGPPDPSLPGYNLYPFSLAAVIGGPSPNPLPVGLFAESPLPFNLVLTAGLTASGRVDPVASSGTAGRCRPSSTTRPTPACFIRATSSR